MRPEELLEFDAAEYAQRAASHSTFHLQEQEIAKTRQSMNADAEVGVGAVGAVLTGGLTFMHPLYASREYYVAENKLKLIQAELTQRGVRLHEPDDKDEEAAALDMVVGDVLGDEVGGDVLGDEAAPEGALQNVAADMVAGQVVEEGVGKIIDAPKPKPKPPPATAGSGSGSGSDSGSCSRMKLPKWAPLKCHSCGMWFDSSLTTYLHCCSHSCAQDGFDLCGSCASAAPVPPSQPQPGIKREERGGNDLRKIEPKKRPRVHSSVRGTLGEKIVCNECDVRLKDVDMYTCEDCLGSYDICLGCYGAGKKCSRHSNVLQRKHVEAW